MVIRYDGETKNGVKYIKSLYTGNARYQSIVDDLDILKPARFEIMAGKGAVTQYTIGSRQVTRNPIAPRDLLTLYDSLMRDKERIEESRRPIRAVGAVFRDW